MSSLRGFLDLHWMIVACFREANEILDLVPDFDKENDSNVSKLHHRRIVEQNISKLENELRNAILEFKKLTTTLNTDLVELEQLRTEMEKKSEDIRTREAAVFLAISNSRENAARCLAKMLRGRVLNLTTSLVVSHSTSFLSSAQRKLKDKVYFFEFVEQMLCYSA
jgi:hypothetical protein